jgi:cytochrome c551/c552
MKAFVFCMAIAAGAAAAASRAEEAGDAARLGADRGCTLCHHDRPAPPDAAVPSAPSWQEIAARYRGKPGAEDELAHFVVAGTDPQHRHWANRAAFAAMPPNRVEVTPEEARALVRWILSSH